jgi:hypothetical protein
MCGLWPDWSLVAAAVIEQADLGIETQRKPVDAASSLRRNKVLIGLGQMIGRKGAIGTKENTFVTAGRPAMNSQG